MYQVGNLQILGLVLDDFLDEVDGPDYSSGHAGFFEISESLNIIYGRNGSGKTRALRSLAHLFNPDIGNEGQVQLLCRIDRAELQRVQPTALFKDAFMHLSRDVIPLFLPFMTPGQVDELGRMEGAIYEEDWEDVRKQMSTLMVDRWELYAPTSTVMLEDVAAELLSDDVFLLRRDFGRLVAEPVLVNDGEKRAYSELSQEDEWQLWKSRDKDSTDILQPLLDTKYVASGWEYEFSASRDLVFWLRADLFEAFSVLGPEIADASVSTSRYLSRAQMGGWAAPNAPDWQEHCDDWVTFDSEGGLTDQCGAALVMRDLQDRANHFFGSLLLDAPHLTLRRSTLSDGISQSVKWEAQTRVGGALIELDALSAAEKKWATVAINLASTTTKHGFVLLDEPEAALHRSSEAHLAKNLQEAAASTGLCVIAASHSPEFLDLPKAETILFRHSSQRTNGEPLTQTMVPADREELRDFGLLPSDVLRRQKGFILVEGQHDLIVWNVLLGEELVQRRIEVLPMRGAAKLKSTLDSRVLFDFTDAHLFPVLDAMSRDVVSDTWSRAQQAKKTEGIQASIEVVLKGLGAFKVDEARLMESFMTRALELNREVRLTPQGITEPDILHYLPVAEFVEDAESWKSLLDELTRSKGSTPSGNEFKKWLRDAKSADLSDSAIKQAAEACDYIPDDFTQVLRQIDQVLAH